MRDDEIVLVDKLEFDAPKTKDMAGIIKTLGCDGGSVLVATAGYDVNVYKSARNIDRVNVVAGEGPERLLGADGQAGVDDDGGAGRVEVGGGVGHEERRSQVARRKPEPCGELIRSEL